MVTPKINLVRYADDLIITAPTKERAEQVIETIDKFFSFLTTSMSMRSGFFASSCSYVNLRESR